MNLNRLALAGALGLIAATAAGAQTVSPQLPDMFAVAPAATYTRPARPAVIPRNDVMSERSAYVGDRNGFGAGGVATNLGYGAHP